MSRAVRSWRFSRKLFEDSIELGERLESGRKCDFAYAKIDIFQKLPRFFEPGAGNVIDELNAGDLFELFAQVSGIDPDRVCHYA